MRDREEKLRASSLILSEASKAGRRIHPLWQILLFPIVFFGSLLVGNLLYGIVIGVLSVLMSDGAATLYDGSTGTQLTLFVTIFPILGTLIYIRRCERRSYASMGFVRRGWLSHYAKGFGAGLAMCAIALLLGLATGSMEFEGVTATPHFGALLITMAGFMVQGMSEEVLIRSYLTVSLANRMPVWIAVIVTSLLFAVMHMANNGITALSFVNLVLFGIFAAVMMLRTDNIWGIGALHSAWNYCQGNLFGVAVSGTDAGATLLNFSAVGGAPDWLSGGAFGLEGSIVTTIVFGVGTLMFLFCKRKEKMSEVSPRNAETLENKL